MLDDLDELAHFWHTRLSGDRDAWKPWSEHGLECVSSILTRDILHSVLDRLSGGRCGVCTFFQGR